MSQSDSPSAIQSSPDQTRAGYVALVGYPNAGKSSLMNQLVDVKLSIVTPLAQTTRERVMGIDTRDGVQMVFLDTPGLVEPRYLLHRAMLHEATETIREADVVLLLVDASAGAPEFPAELLQLLLRAPSLIVVANKVDVATREQVRAIREWSRELLDREPREVSALTGQGTQELRAAIAEQLPHSPYLYPEEDVSSQPVRFFVAELVRETAFEMFEKEVPYSIAAKVDEFREAETPIYIRVTVYVERPTQKAILIGRGGAAIKALGSEARRKIETFVGAPVFLDLWVKVLPRWRRDPLQLQRFGFKLPAPEQPS